MTAALHRGIQGRYETLTYQAVEKLPASGDTVSGIGRNST